MTKEITLDEALKLVFEGNDVLVVRETPMHVLMIDEIRRAVEDGAKFIIEVAEEETKPDTLGGVIPNTDDERVVTPLGGILDRLIPEDPFSGEEAIANHEETEVPPPVNKADDIVNPTGPKIDKGKIIALYRGMWKIKDIAEDVGCSQGTVYKVVNEYKEKKNNG